VSEDKPKDPGHVPYSEGALAELAHERVFAGSEYEAAGEALERQKRVHDSARAEIELIDAKLERMAKEGFPPGGRTSRTIRVIVPEDSAVKTTVVEIQLRTELDSFVCTHDTDIVVAEPKKTAGTAGTTRSSCEHEGTDLCCTCDIACTLPGRMERLAKG